MKQKFTVEGMSCVNCVAAVEKTVKELDGLCEVDVNLLSKSMVCEFDGSALSSKKIINAVNKAGYKCSLYGESVSDSGSLSEKGRLIISAILLLPLMYVSMGEMLSIPIPTLFVEKRLLSSLFQLVLALAVAFINSRFYTRGYSAIFKGAPNMDSLVALGSSASFIYGIFKMISGNYSHGLYFDSAAMILTLVTVGKMLEERAKRKTGSAIEKLSRLSPESANVIRDGVEIEIKTSEIVLGDIVVIRPGEYIPVDGVIVEGDSEINESALTGESVPKYKTVGDEVMSATVNLTGAFKMEARRVGGDTVLARIIELVESTSASKAPVSRLADKVASVFVPIVAAISVVTAIVWLVAGESFDLAFSSAVSVLVISCPCALGLATPVAITVAVGKLAGEGILCRSAEALETLGKTEVAVFDKTGTLTKGKPVVTDFFAVSDNENDVLDIALSIEGASEHPLAGAICDYAREKGASDLSCEDFRAVPGRGVSAKIDKKQYYAGNAAYMSALGIDISKISERAENLAASGKTVMLLASESDLLGLLAASDELSSGSIETLRELEALGVESVMLTGDGKLNAGVIAEKIGISRVISEVLPDEKERVVSELTSEGKITVMVGDGINDAPALGAASVGIALGAGSDIAIDTADVVLVKNDLSGVSRAVKYSRSVMTNIKENLFWAFFYNAICIPIAAGVLYPTLGITLSPMIASAAMSISSLFVVCNALRLYKK